LCQNYIAESILWFFLQLKFPLIIPNSKLKIGWDFFIMCLCLAHFYILNLCLCLEYNFGSYTTFILFYRSWIRGIIGFFALDIVQKFNAGYFINGSQTLDKKTIILNYLKSDFVYDCCGIISLLFESLGNLPYQYEVLIKLLFFFKYFK